MSKVIKNAAFTIDRPKVMTLFPRLSSLGTQEGRGPENLPEGQGASTESRLAVEAEAERILDEASQHVQSLLATARDQAAILIQSARQEAMAIRESAMAEGESLKTTETEKGYRHGYDQAIREATAHAEQIMATAWQEAEAARQAKAAYVQGNEQEIVDLAILIAEKIVHCEIDRDSDAVVAIVVAALAKVQDMTHVVVRVHSGDSTAIEAVKPQLYSMIKGLRTLGIEKDDSIARGGCIVETGNGFVDARIEAQMGEVLRVVRDVMDR